MAIIFLPMAMMHSAMRSWIFDSRLAVASNTPRTAVAVSPNELPDSDELNALTPDMLSASFC